MTLRVSGLDHLPTSQRRRDGLRDDLARAGYVRGAFARQDGQWPMWFRTDLVLSRPGLLARCASLLEPCVPANTDRLAARGAAAVALATAISLNTNIPLLLCADEDGSVHVHGERFPDARVALVEDVVLTGRHALESVNALRAAELDVVAILVLLDREDGGRLRIEDEEVESIVGFREQELQT
jgi:uridine monophosphate synthetase